MDNFIKAKAKSNVSLRAYVAQAMKEMDGMNPKPTRKQLVKSYYLARKDDIRVNDTYQVAIDWDSTQNGALTPMEECKVIHLSIKRLDKEPIMDYRDLMTIKDKIVGEEFEALMLYPARSREHDMANQYHLWIPTNKEDGEPLGIPFGWSCGRRVFTESKLGGKQRSFEGWRT